MVALIVKAYMDSGPFLKTVLHTTVNLLKRSYFLKFESKCENLCIVVHIIYLWFHFSFLSFFG